MKQPMQPIYRDQHGTNRFHPNAIVRFLLDQPGGVDLNRLAMMYFPPEDRVQFAQLIGYSVAGFHELGYVSDEDADAASEAELAQGLPASGCRAHGCEIHVQGKAERSER